MGIEEVTNAPLPFGLGELDFTEISTIFVLGGLVLGMAAWHATSRVGQNVGDRALNWVGQFVPGGNPGEGDGGLQLGA